MFIYDDLQQGQEEQQSLENHNLIDQNSEGQHQDETTDSENVKIEAEVKKKEENSSADNNANAENNSGGDNNANDTENNPDGGNNEVSAEIPPPPAPATMPMQVNLNVTQKESNSFLSGAVGAGTSFVGSGVGYGVNRLGRKASETLTSVTDRRRYVGLISIKILEYVDKTDNEGKVVGQVAKGGLAHDFDSICDMKMVFTPTENKLDDELDRSMDVTLVRHPHLDGYKPSEFVSYYNEIIKKNLYATSENQGGCRDYWPLKFLFEFKAGKFFKTTVYSIKFVPRSIERQQETITKNDPEERFKMNGTFDLLV